MNSSECQSLLIVSCSQRKRSDLALLPAIDRYDGPAFRLLRRFFREKPSVKLDTFILSAKFGLIAKDKLIPNYDQRMTKEQSQEIQPGVLKELQCIFRQNNYQRLCLCMGQNYLLALDGYDKTKLELTVQYSTGSIGKQLAILYDWLYGKPTEPSLDVLTSPSTGQVSLKGIKIVKTPTEILDLARQALLLGKGNPDNYQTWYVLVDDRRVSPKWLISQLTGLPVSAFHSIKARQMLQQLGIKIYSELSN